VSSGQIDVAHVAKLARLALSADEVERFGAQLGALLEHVQTLQKLPTAEVAATAQVIPSVNVMRDDVAQPCLPREVVLEAAPQRQGSYFRVPRILGEPG
jgi:aspartyl-tRNA(Asn)/glutamyl-tRNA(Gln) amidotransferase subunit C